MEVAQLPRTLARTAASISSWSDDELIAEIIVGSDAAFEALYQRHCCGMLAMARQMLGSPTEAEDAVQHAFLAAYRELEGGVTPTHPRAWLYAILRNRCLNMVRDRRPGAALPAGADAEPSTVGLAEEVERRADLRDLLRDMRRLPEEQRTALALFEMGGLTQAEIAQAMGTSPSRVKALVFQARSSLIHARAASDATCGSVREKLATLRGGRLNTRELRTHVRDCAGCAEYALAVREQRRRLAIVLPVIPLMAAAKAPLVGGGVALGTVGSGVSSAVRKLAWLRPRPSVLAFAAAGAGATAAAALAVAAVMGGSEPEPPREPAARPAAVAAPAPAVAATATPIAKPASAKRSAAKSSKPRRAAKRKKARKAKRAAAAAPATSAAAAAPTPAAPAAPEPAAPASPPQAAPAPSPAPAAPSPPAAAEPPGQDFDLDGNAPAAEPEAPGP